MARRLKTEANWECSVCHTVTHRLAVHHIRPIERMKEEDKERMCYDESNLQVVCYDCHKAIHDAMRSHRTNGNWKPTSCESNETKSKTMMTDALPPPLPHF